MTRRFVLIAAASLVATAAAADGDIALEDAPASVKEAALRAAPGVELVSVSVETENGVSVYEFEARGKDGALVEIDVREDGTVEEVETLIAMSDVPAPVVAALNEAAPGFAPEEVELSIREGGARVYEFEGVHEGRDIELEIDEAGTLLVMAED